MSGSDHRSMERKQLIERLELMKKELAKKQQKLEKAKRAARVKAHVKQKIQELNLRTSDDQHRKQPAAPDGQNTQLVLRQDIPDVILNEPEVSDCKIDTKDSFQQLKESARQDENRKSDNSVRMGSNSVASVSNQSEAVVPDVKDSLTITPTFRSLKATSSSFQDSLSYAQNLCQALGRFTDLDSFASTFTLNLNSEASTQGIESDLQFEENYLMFRNASGCAVTRVSNAARLPNSESEKRNSVKARKCLSNVDCPDVHALVNSENEVITNKQEKCELDRKLIPDIKPSSENSSVLLPAPNHDSNKAVLRLQDILSEEDVGFQKKEQLSSYLSEKAFQDHFLDYTELDAVPFSHFELTEDFLSESSQNASYNSSQSRGRKKVVSAIVQRRSPRLSSLKFGSMGMGISKPNKQEGYRLGCQKAALCRMARKQKKSKTKRALFISSLFQYLIDEAKRETAFVEFTLPEDIAKLALCSWNRTGTNTQFISKLSQCAIVRHCTEDSMDMEMIPETEIIPDFESQKTSDVEFEVNFGDGQHADGQSSKLSSVVVEMETNAINMTQQSQDNSITGPTELLRLLGTSENVSSLSIHPAILSNHFDNVLDDIVHQHFDNKEGHLEAVNAVCINARKLSTLARKSTTSELTVKENITVEDSLSSYGAKTECADCDDHVITRLHVPLTAKDKDDNFTTDSADYIHHCPVRDQSLKQIASVTSMTRDSVSSPVLFSCQSESQKEKEDQDNQKEKWKPVFMPSKGKITIEAVESAKQAEVTRSKCWLRFTGCVESGCTDQVVDTIVGTVITDSEETAFILCVQTTALTLWTMDDWQWLAEFHWYLPETNKAEGACRVHTTDRELAVLVWGLDVECHCFNLTVFVYHWDTQHTQHFALPLPSPVFPHRVFCHGLQWSENCVLVFTSDNSFTRGKRYLLDSHHGSVTMELAMEETNSQVIDLCLVDPLPDAVAGLTVDHKVLVWNHKTGSLILTLPLPDNLVTLSKMHTCYSTQGYLLFHMTDVENNKDLCLAALNPTTGTGRVIKRFSTNHEEDTDWLRVSTFQDVLLTVSHDGTVHFWDAYSAKLALVKNTSSKTQTAVMFCAKGSYILLTGQENGCLHLFAVCVSSGDVGISGIKYDLLAFSASNV